MAARLPALAPERYRVIRPPRTLAHRAGHAWEQALLPLAARGCQIIYSPANLAPLASARNVVVIHDVAAIRHPQWYGRVYARYQRLVLPALARRARAVITVSEFSRAEIVEVLGAPPDRVAVIPNGVDDRFGPDSAPPPQRPYVLAVGTQIARKNLSALSEAASALSAHGIDLVAAGSSRAYMHFEPVAGLKMLGYVDDESLPALYAGARAVVMPSLYEGFGIPCIEAMASGVPVVSSNAAALPETCGDAALLVDPGDRAAIADAVVAAACDESIRAPLIERGLARAKQFSWAATAAATDRLLAGLLDGA